MGLNKKVGKSKKSVTRKNVKVKALVNFEEYMKGRNLADEKLTRSDLEQFCLQKICKAIINTKEVEELHQKIKKQENVIEHIRQDLQQLAKQARDLNVVNKKLMSDLKNRKINQKAPEPLRITRSVGLQVRLNVGTEPAEPIIVRKSCRNKTPRTPDTPNKNPENENINTSQGNSDL